MIFIATLLKIILGLSLAAFITSTIVLAWQNARLQNELRALEENGTSTTPETAGSNRKINYRLPKAVYPTNYRLYLHPDITTRSYTGKVTISIKVAKKTKQIILHAVDLEISSAFIIGKRKRKSGVKKYFLDKRKEFLIINLHGAVKARSNLDLVIAFKGTMANKLVGLYSSSYLKADGSKKWIATSKFEPTHARKAFPCFDEPALKATYEITLVHPKGGGYHALSNMNEMASRDRGSFVEVSFKKSVPMSTYLVCFIISDFAHKKTAIDTKGVGKNFELRVFATSEQIDKVDFALNVGKAVMEHYVDYFQIEYPLPKMDMVAIPDFASGAMENWGLVTYRETLLLYNKKTSSTLDKQSAARTIAHEFCHMWFGNLVTMMWWNNLWLNEGFAEYIENKGIEAVFPEWKMLDQFIIINLHPVLRFDASLSSHPIVVSVTNPDQINEIFDTITYNKGSALIRMLEDFIKPANFRKAVTNYLDKHKFKNAVTNDLLAEIDKLKLGFDVKKIMRTWTEQMGLPVVNVKKISETQYSLRQKRFLSNPKDYDASHSDSPFSYKWTIPITYKTSNSETVGRKFFYYNQNEVIINLSSAVNWIKFNYDQYGYYRVNYELPMWADLANQLTTDPKAFSASDRACLLNDAFSLADATQLSYDVALNMTKYLGKETEYAPWDVAAEQLIFLKRNLMFTDVYIKYKEYARSLIQDIYSSIGWGADDNHIKNLLRLIILNTACSLELPACLNEASTQFKAFLAKPTERPHADVRKYVYYYGMMKAGDESSWSQMWEVFVTEKDASEKSKLMYGLSAIQIPWILSRFVQLAWNETFVRGQDYYDCLQNIAANPIGESIVWEYIRENWSKLVARFGLNARYLGRMIPEITHNFATQTRLHEIESFFAKYPNAGAGAAARDSALNEVKSKIIWLKKIVIKLPFGWKGKLSSLYFCY